MKNIYRISGEKKFIFLLLVLCVLFNGCKGDSEKEKLRDFGRDIANAIIDNNAKIVKTFYPDENIQGVGFSEPMGELTIGEKNSLGITRISYAKNTWIDVKENENGELYIIDSHGILMRDNAPTRDNSPTRAIASASDNSGPRLLKVSEINDGPNTALYPMEGNTYHATNMFDGKSSTSWAVRLETTNYDIADYLWGPSFRVNGNKLSHIIIRNGYQKNSKVYYNNTRATWVRIFRMSDDGILRNSDILYEGPLKDTMGAQTLPINPDFDQTRRPGRIALAFLPKGSGGYNRGDKWNDLSISELQFWGY